MRLPRVLLVLSLSLFPLRAPGSDEPPRPDGDGRASAAAAPVDAVSAQASPAEVSLAEARRLLEAGGLRVLELEVLGRGGWDGVGKVRFAASPDARLRSEEAMVFLRRSRAPGCWRVTVSVLVSERLDLTEEPVAARAALDAALRAATHLISRPFRPVDEEGAEEDEEGDGEGEMTRARTLRATHHASPLDPRPFAAFLAEVAEELVRVLGIQAEGAPFLVLPGEAEREPLEAARRHLAQRLLARSLAGLPAGGAHPGDAVAEDPLSLASHPLEGYFVRRLEHSDLATELLPELGADPLASLVGHRALRLGLAVLAEDRRPEDVAALRALAFEAGSGRPANAWALHHWARFLIRSLPESDHQAQVVEALDALRHSCRLGCELALGYYLHLLDIPKEPLVGGESHWEERARWDALWPIFNPHKLPEATEVERAYRAGDLSPVRFGVAAEGEVLRQVRLAVGEMNAARKARGWKLIEVVEEKPASEPLAEEAPKKEDPAAAGSPEET
jgi:hypothetical protein